MNDIERTYFLSDLAGKRIIAANKKIGKLADFCIVDKDKVAEVTHLYVSRPFGDKPLIIPWDKFKAITPSGIEVDIVIDTLSQYEVEAGPGMIMLKDYILDKKVFDAEGREVEVVYDIKMVFTHNKLYVIGVDISLYGLFRRLGLKWLVDFIYTLARKIKRQTLSWNYVQSLPEHLGSFSGDLKLKILKEKLSDMPAVDVADILEELDPEQRGAIFGALDTDHASDTLEELDPKVQRDLIASLQKDKAAQLINEMTPGQAADILSILPWWEVRAILDFLDKEDAENIRQILESQEQKIINFAETDCLKFPPDRTVLQTRRSYQKAAKGKNVVMYLYIVDEQDKLIGVIDIKELLRANDEELLSTIMVTKIISLHPDSTFKQAAELFNRYGFRALPITDENNKLLGVIPYRDLRTLKNLLY